MTEQEQAASDPRVGDKWEHPNGDTIEVVPPDDYRVKLLWPDGETWRSPQVQFEKHAAGWTLAERGPAPAAEKPSRDPHTTPVVGDEWISGNVIFDVVLVNASETQIQRKDRIEPPMPYPGYTFTLYSKGWRLHRRGDDPAWRPEGERDDGADAWHADPDGWRRVGWNANIAIDDSIIETLNQEWPTLGEFADAVSCDIELVNDTLTAVGRVAVFGGIWKFTEAGAPGNECPEAWKPGLRSAFLSELRAIQETPAPAIKVGDRVRHFDGDEGTVEAVSKESALVRFDGDAKATEQFFEWLTIIPPAAAPDQDDTGDEPLANIGNIGAPWQIPSASILDELDAIAKAEDDTGDEPPTPEPMPFATYQPDPVEEQHYRDSNYIRVIRSIGGKTAIEVDVYEVLEAFAVNCPATAHALKKILCAGIRGSKSRMQDLREARDSIMRAMEMQHQREAVAAAKGST